MSLWCSQMFAIANAVRMVREDDDAMKPGQTVYMKKEGRGQVTWHKCKLIEFGKGTMATVERENGTNMDVAKSQLRPKMPKSAEKEVPDAGA